VLNQIADKAVLIGTTRADSQEINDLILKRVRTIVDGTSKSMDMPIKFSVMEGPVPRTI